MDRREVYLGDGLYASYDGFSITLRAPRSEGNHWVALEPAVLQALIHYVEQVRGVKITVEKKEEADD